MLCCIFAIDKNNNMTRKEYLEGKIKQLQHELDNFSWRIATDMNRGINLSKEFYDYEKQFLFDTISNLHLEVQNL